MRSITTLILLFVLEACSRKKEPSEVGNPVEPGGTEGLEKEVMEVHDEVMPRMGELYTWKTRLKSKLDSASVSEKRREELVVTINKIDSAYQGMMTWMHQYNPVPDSVNHERAREYLENEMQKIKKVRNDIVEAIEKAEDVAKEKK